MRISVFCTSAILPSLTLSCRGDPVINCSLPPAPPDPPQYCVTKVGLRQSLSPWQSQQGGPSNIPLMNRRNVIGRLSERHSWPCGLTLAPVNTPSSGSPGSAHYNCHLDKRPLAIISHTLGLVGLPMHMSPYFSDRHGLQYMSEPADVPGNTETAN